MSDDTKGLIGAAALIVALSFMVGGVVGSCLEYNDICHQWCRAKAESFETVVEYRACLKSCDE